MGVGLELISFRFFVLGCHGNVRDPVVCDGGYFSVFPELFLYIFSFPPVFPVEAAPALSL